MHLIFMPQVLQELNWLNQNPQLEEISCRYPQIFEAAVEEVSYAAKCGRQMEISKTKDIALQSWQTWARRIEKSRNNPKVIENALPHLLKSRITMLTLERCYLAATSGQVEGTVRFKLLNGLILQLLLFKKKLIPKLISYKTFRFWWFFITQKRIVMPLFSRKGIYCFYTREFIESLEKIINGRSCLEIAAGNGALSQFLLDAGVAVTATDNFSWKNISQPSEKVERLAAKQALEKYQPRVVICSWPPYENDFEKYVFKTSSVDTYIMIGSKNKMLTGNWDCYKEQNTFDMEADENLSKYVVPHENFNTVLVFRRKP